MADDTAIGHGISSEYRQAPVKDGPSQGWSTQRVPHMFPEDRTGGRTVGTEDHWERVYAKSTPNRVSWFQRRPERSLSLVAACAPTPMTRILDVGGGTSTLVDELLAAGFNKIGVLDISETALGLARERLGADAGRVEWFTTDVGSFVSPHPWDIWHDRAVFHFLVAADDRAAYRRTLQQSLAPGGHAVISTFGPEGPTRCSGLDVVRYSPESLLAELGPAFSLVESQDEIHRTPNGADQQFVYCRFRRS